MPLVLDGTNGVSGVDGTASNPAIEGTDSNTGIFYPAADTVAIGTGGTEALRVTSAQNVGIGTSSPSAKLTVASGAIRMSDGFEIGWGDNSTFIAGNGSSDVLQFATAAAERMRLDSSGNLGLGVTPSAWDAGYQVLQNSGGALWSGSSTAVRLTQNTYYATNYKYVSAAAASMYAQVSGAHQWFNAASGSANANITFTQAMTLNSDGDLLVGLTSAILNSTNRRVLNVNGTNDAAITVGRGGSISTSGYLYHSSSELRLANVENSPLTFYTNNTERARITAGGEIKFRNATGGTDTADTYTSITIGNDSTYAGGLLNVKNAGNRGNKGNVNGSPLARFEFNDATALFIDTSGEVRIGSTTDQGAYNLQCNGTGVWGAAAYVNGSDERIKEDIAPITSGLDVVTKLNPVTYRYKKDWSNDQNIQTGFIAQELLVSMEGKNYVNGIVLQGGSEGYYSVAYQNIIPLLTKAIQEQQAMIEEMKAEIAALKAQP